MIGEGRRGGEEGKGCLLVACFLHFVPVLVADAVVDGFEGDIGQEFFDGVDVVDGLVTRREDTAITRFLDKGVGCIAVCLDNSSCHFSKFVLLGHGLLDADGSSIYHCLIDTLCVIDFKSNVLDGITVL